MFYAVVKLISVELRGRQGWAGLQGLSRPSRRPGSGLGSSTGMTAHSWVVFLTSGLSCSPHAGLSSAIGLRIHRCAHLFVGSINLSHNLSARPALGAVSLLLCSLALQDPENCQALCLTQLPYPVLRQVDTLVCLCLRRWSQSAPNSHSAMCRLVHTSARPLLCRSPVKWLKNLHSLAKKSEDIPSQDRVVSGAGVRNSNSKTPSPPATLQFFCFPSLRMARTDPHPAALWRHQRLHGAKMGPRWVSPWMP